MDAELVYTPKVRMGVPPAITAALLLQSLLPLAICGWYSWRGFRLERA
jgi:hypothetical protein